MSIIQIAPVPFRFRRRTSASGWPDTTSRPFTSPSPSRAMGLRSDGRCDKQQKRGKGKSKKKGKRVRRTKRKFVTSRVTPLGGGINISINYLINNSRFRVSNDLYRSTPETITTITALYRTCPAPRVSHGLPSFNYTPHSFDKLQVRVSNGADRIRRACGFPRIVIRKQWAAASPRSPVARVEDYSQSG